MDKNNLAQGSAIFQQWEEQLVFHSGRYADVHLRFEEPGLASGFIQNISMPGMQLTELSIKAGQTVQLVDEVKEAAESVFVLDGHAESSFQNLAAPISLHKGHHNLQYNSHFGGAHTIQSGRFHALAITYDLDFLGGILQSDDSRSVEQLANCLSSQRTYLASPNSLPWRGRVPEVLAAVKQCPFAGGTRYLFLESKMMELLVLQLQQASVDERIDGDWSPADRERFYALRDFIEQHYLEVFTLKDLTYKFGLNEFKLKKGYKQLFKMTVFGHVHHLRMQKAQSLLQEASMNVSEAAFFIGYHNVSSFCTEFKKRFGYSPGKVSVC